MSSLTGRKALITGATGFLGRHLTRAIICQGGQVIGISRTFASSSEAFTPVTADIRDAATLRTVFLAHRPDYVFHLAATVVTRKDRSLVEPLLETNLLGSVHVMNAALDSGCTRFVFAGTIDDSPSGSAPHSPYGLSKLCAGIYARYFATELRLPLTYARLGMVYGPEQDVEKLVPHITTALLNGRRPLLRDPRRECDLIFVDDAVKALVDVCINTPLPAMDITSGEIVAAGDLITMIEEAIARVPERDIIGDSRTDLRAGLIRTARWYKLNRRSA